MSLTNYILASIPLLFPAWTAIDLLENPWAIANWWFENLSERDSNNLFANSNDGDIVIPSVSSQLWVYSLMGISGYLLTDRLVPKIKVCLYCPHPSTVIGDIICHL